MQPAASEAKAGSAGGNAVSSRARSAGGWLSCAGLAALAFRELLRFQTEQALPKEIEAWFFVPSTSVTPAVVVLSLWLLYRRVPVLRALTSPPGARGVGVALLAGGISLYTWATYTGAVDLLVPSLMLLSVAAAWLWRGAAAVRAVRVPVAFLVFAMLLPAPLLNEVVYLLQLGTTELTGWILYGLGVPHVVSGERIVRPENTFSVIEACSGLRSMETLTIVSILMVDLFRRRGLHAWLLVLVAPVAAFVLNGVRAVLLILNPHSEIAAIHNLQGVAILLSGLVLLFVLDGLLEWGARRRQPATAGAAAPRGETVVATDAGGRASAAVAGALATACALSFWLPRWEADPEEAYSLYSHFSRGLGSTFTTRLDTDRLFLGSTGFRNSVTLRYARSGASPVVLFVAVGARSNRNRSPLSPKTGLPGSGWIVEEEFPLTLEPGSQSASGSTLRSGSNRVLSYHWRQGAAGWLAEALRAFFALDRSPLRRPEEILVVRIGTGLGAALPREKSAAEQTLLSFYHLLRPLLDGLELKLGKSFSRFS